MVSDEFPSFLELKAFTNTWYFLYASRDKTYASRDKTYASRDKINTQLGIKKYAFWDQINLNLEIKKIRIYR